MITHGDLIWWHLPRSGGTATAAWLRAVDAALSLGLSIDADEQPAKHDNRLIRELRTSSRLTQRHTAINLRPLPEWLVSNFKFARRAGLHVPFDRYQGGEFFSLRLGAWCPADWWLGYFALEERTHFLRTDRLEEDWRGFLQKTIGVCIPETLRMEVANAIPLPAGEDRSLLDHDWSRAFDRNPQWRDIEASL